MDERFFYLFCGIAVITLITVFGDLDSKFSPEFEIRGGDDAANLQETKIKNDLPSLLSLEYTSSVITNTNYNPVFNTVWLVLSKLYGSQLRPYRLFTFGLHILNSGLFFLVLISFSIERKSALVSSILFVVFPYNLETVLWVTAGIHHGVTITLLFLTILSFRKYLESGKRTFLGLTYLLYVLGCGSKQIFYPTFILLFLLEIHEKKLGFKDLAGISYKKYIPPVFTTIIFMFIQYLRYPFSHQYQYSGGALFHPLIFFRLFDFLKELVVPANVGPGLLTLLLMFLFFLIFYSIIVFQRDSSLYFWTAWVFLLGLPQMTQSIRPLAGSVRYTYVISIGVFALIACINSRSKSLVFSLLPPVLLLIYFLGHVGVL